MRTVLFLLFIVYSVSMAQETRPFGIIIHGGAGSLDESKTYEAHLQVLQDALEHGYDILERGGTSLEAVESVIMLLENSPLFNAGKGSVTNLEGYCEMDASIMEGKEKKAGAVAGLQHVKNPIQAARLVMEQTPHVLLIGPNAEKFLRKKGVKTMDKKYFLGSVEDKPFQESKYGTVGACALDKYGNLAAGTSTGGMANKMPGRVGDSPIIGAGTYADNNHAAVSCTGHGEYFIRNAVAYDLIAQMKYQNLPIDQAADNLIMNKLLKLSALGGLIVIDNQANVHASFNTPMMFHAFKTSKGLAKVALKK